jgi:hypothetical protein
MAEKRRKSRIASPLRVSFESSPAALQAMTVHRRFSPSPTSQRTGEFRLIPVMERYRRAREYAQAAGFDLPLTIGCSWRSRARASAVARLIRSLLRLRVLLRLNLFQ